ncbi:MAG: Rid family detoxifying hydrolase [Chloroflexi bacterium]|nr:Rid family detoxifying hydrolase [Chloroflexota bacterium]MCC6894875.1 reactive intermediate/imine deaminase [Anaerolineae bacterium]
MSKQVIATNNAPGAAGPYSQGIVANGFVFVSGQIAVVPGTKDFVVGGIKEQTIQTLNNVKAILEAGGSSMDKIVRTTVYLSDVTTFAEMNAVYATFFGENPPARSTVQAVLPRAGALIEVDCIALA